MFEFVTGQREPQGLGIEKKLLQELMFKQSPTQTLPEILQNLQYIHGQESLIFKLLSVYAGNKQAVPAIHDLQGMLTSYHNARDFRLRWLT